MTNRKLLLNAFLPSAGIDDPHRFAGRKEEVEELTDALLVKNSVPLIYGPRGLGKSSLALQLSRIAQGDVDLLSELDLEDLALEEDDRFIVVYLTCTDETKNAQGVIRMMINGLSVFQDQKESERNPDKYKLIDKTTKRRISLKLFSSETTKTYNAQAKKISTSKFTPEEKLVHLVELVYDVYKQPVLFIVDEFDRLGSTKGFASFLKSQSSEYLKVALVGIGATEGTLLRDHKSLDRQLMPVRVPKMARIELESIFDRTEDYLLENGIEYGFSAEAARLAARTASGFPWFMHVLGQTALLEVEKHGRAGVGEHDIRDAIASLPKRRLAKQYNDRYLLAVRDSYYREVVLRLCAGWMEEDIPTSEIYRRANKVGVNSPSQYMGHLTRTEHGQVITRSLQQSRVYAFTDEVFKAYVRMRPSTYAGVKDEVDRVLRE